jgi:predicted secreted protein
MAKIKGELLILYVWDSSIYRPIACLTQNSLSETQNIIESQTKCDPGVITKIAGSYSYELSAEGEYIDTTSAGAEVTSASHDYLHSVFGTEVTWKLATGLTDTDFYFGTAILNDLSMDAAAGDDLATFSASLTGTGLIVEIDPNA